MARVLAHFVGWLWSSAFALPVVLAWVGLASRSPLPLLAGLLVVVALGLWCGRGALFLLALFAALPVVLWVVASAFPVVVLVGFVALALHAIWR